MKKISIILLMTLVTSVLSAQTEANKSVGELEINWYKTGWFLEGNAGVRFLGQTSEFAEMKIRPTINGSLGYFFNEKFGIKGRIDAHQFRADYTYDGMEDLSMSISASAEVLVRLLQLKQPNISRKFDLNAHAGLGLTAFINPSYKRYTEEKVNLDYVGKVFKADNMGHIILGITPQYHINSRVSINLDISHFTQFKQFRTYDTYSAVEAKSVTGVLATTIGLTIRP